MYSVHLGETVLHNGTSCRKPATNCTHGHTHRLDMVTSHRDKSPVSVFS